MVIRNELRIFDQIVTSVSFGVKNGNPPRNAGTLKTIACVPNGYTGIVVAWGALYLFMKYDVFRQNADFLRNGADQLSIIILLYDLLM